MAGFHLGASVDADPDGQQHPSALGDANDGHDDEDGVVFDSLLVPGMDASIRVTASQPGTVNAWIDFDQDGIWESHEAVLADPVAAGVNALVVPISADAFPGITFARFRYSSGGGLAPDGPAADGEVEDYMLQIEAVVDRGTVDFEELVGLESNVGRHHLPIRDDASRICFR